MIQINTLHLKYKQKNIHKRAQVYEQMLDAKNTLDKNIGFVGVNIFYY